MEGKSKGKNRADNITDRVRDDCENHEKPQRKRRVKKIKKSMCDENEELDRLSGTIKQKVKTREVEEPMKQSIRMKNDKVRDEGLDINSQVMNGKKIKYNERESMKSTQIKRRGQTIKLTDEKMLESDDGLEIDSEVMNGNEMKYNEKDSMKSTRIKRRGQTTKLTDEKMLESDDGLEIDSEVMNGKKMKYNEKDSLKSTRIKKKGQTIKLTDEKMLESDEGLGIYNEVMNVGKMKDSKRESMKNTHIRQIDYKMNNINKNTEDGAVTAVNSFLIATNSLFQSFDDDNEQDKCDPNESIEQCREEESLSDFITSLDLVSSNDKQ